MNRAYSRLSTTHGHITDDIIWIVLQSICVGYYHNCIHWYSSVHMPTSMSIIPEFGGSKVQNLRGVPQLVTPNRFR